MTALHNVPYVTPVLGAIRLGHIVENNGKRRPQKDDFFTITGLHKEGGAWVQHALHAESLAKQEACKSPEAGNGEIGRSGAVAKLREIPVKVLYSDPDLNASERYEAYDRTAKRVICAGDGMKARRLMPNNEINDEACPGARNCEFGIKHGCNIFGRAMFKVEGQTDALGGFIMRTTSYNAVNTLRSKLTGMHSLFGEKLPHVPLKLVLRTKSSQLSMNSAFYYADLEIVGDLVDVAIQAGERVQKLRDAGIDAMAYERKMKELRANGAFEDPLETFEDREEFLDGDMITLPGDGATMALGPTDEFDGAAQDGVAQHKSEGAKTVTVRTIRQKRAPTPGEGLGNIQNFFETPSAGASQNA
jgi:hypothetical protein